MTTHSLLLVGCGKMGGVLLERWRATPLFSTIHVISPNHSHADEPGLHWHRDLASLPPSFTPTVITFAVKPAQLASLLPIYAKAFAATAPLYLSVAAGKPLAFYRAHLGEHAHIVRAMPNTPSLIGEGMTALCAADTLSAAIRKTATDMMQTVGDVLWIENESQMEAVTAISGCGPAYVFLFIDSLINAATQAGLTAHQARQLAMQTIKGSQALAASSPKTLPELCAQVASPGGATEAALKVLTKDDALKTLMQQAVTAAITRSKEMAS
jgi:pyrroline-5-carboxylate reductase